MLQAMNLPAFFHSGVTAQKAFGAGGKGIRTPGLLIANETLYQLSYTPVIRTVRLARAADFSSTETSASSGYSAEQTETP